VAPPIFARLAEALPAAHGALVVFELPGELELSPTGWTLVKRLGSGRHQPTVAFFRRAPQST
jgi:16S rRNA (guanine966-N2)-methyltransferase